jgi:hypothetical protein
MSDTRQHVHELIDRLPPSRLAAVAGLLEAMLDPIDRKLAHAPIDDEPETEEERMAVAEAIESMKRKGGIPMEEVLADFGLTLDDFRRMADSDSPERKQA